MKPLIVLVGVFALSLIVLRVLGGEWNYVLAGNIGLAAMLLFTAVGHFAFTKGMIMMLPDVVPFKKAVVVLTGLLEIAGAAGLLISSWRETTAMFLILFFVLLLPANIHAAIRKVDYQKGTYTGAGMDYLWFRVPLQLLFIAWVYYFGIYTQ